jgi:hypothetical protein
MYTEYDQSDVDRFWNSVDIVEESECWLWSKGLTQDGYGKFKCKHKTWVASRFAYYITRGFLPDGMLICHKCDNPKCCNPSHIYLGTSKENLREASLKGHLRGMPNGRKLQNMKTGEVYYSVREAQRSLSLNNYKFIYESLKSGKEYKGIFLRDLNNAVI